MYSPVKQRVSEIESVPAPVKGLNDIDSIAAMEPQFALDMVNYFPDNTSLKIREGYVVWQQDMLNVTKTLIAWLPYTGTPRLLAACDGGIYDVTNQNSVSASMKFINEGRLSHVHFGGISNQYLVCANDNTADSVIFYDGSTWKDFTLIATPSNPGEIKGIDPKLLSYVHSHKKRLWFIQKDTMTAWYLPLEQMGGDAKPFYLGGVFPRGGKLIAIYTWSLDAGDGMDDVLLFLTDRGEVAGYQGNDPAVATDWKLSAVHFIANTLTDRPFADFGSDLIMLTTYGAIPLSKVVGGALSISPQEASLSKNISKTLNKEVARRGSTIGWEIHNMPSIQSLVVVLPQTTNFPAVQFIMNSVTNAWTKYDLPILTTAMFNMFLFFSDNKGRILRFGGTYLDDVPLTGTGGKPVVASFMQAYHYFKNRGINKHYNFIRPIWISNYIPSYVLDISVDFSPKNIYNLPEPPPDYLPESLWGKAIWGQNLWTPSTQSQFKWDGVEGLGYCASLIVRARGNRPIEYVGADWVYEKGTSL